MSHDEALYAAAKLRSVLVRRATLRRDAGELPRARLFIQIDLGCYSFSYKTVEDFAGCISASE